VHATKIMLGLLMATMLLPVVALADDDDKDEKAGSFLLAAPPNARWQQECGSCHLAFAPAFLPAQSWRTMMQGLDKHFGTDATLGAPETAEISAFLVKNASNRWSGAATPLRITETRGFMKEHDAKEVPAAVWKRESIKSAANCAACHPHADKGTFNEKSIKVPN
jgi:hypothetical protein